MDNISGILSEKMKEKYNHERNILNEKIANDEATALSNYEIDQILNGKTKILTYNILPHIGNIKELLEPYKNFILLYMTEPNYGHWVCILKHPDRIEFFDPYGGKNIPDKELDVIKDHVKEITNQDFPYLSKLIYESGLPIEYNNYQFQQYNKDIKTCGRHCIVRVIFKNLLLDDYHKLMTLLKNKYNLTYDQIVTLITSNMLA